MKGLTIDAQRVLWSLRDGSSWTESAIISAILTGIEPAALRTVMNKERKSIVREKRKYAKARQGPPKPRSSKYGFGLMAAGGSETYEAAQYGVTVKMIVENARAFANRWGMNFSYREIRPGVVRIGFTPLAEKP